MLLFRPVLGPESDWAQVSATPVLVGDEFQVLDENAPQKYYRLALRHP